MCVSVDFGSTGGIVPYMLELCRIGPFDINEGWVCLNDAGRYEVVELSRLALSSTDLKR